MITMIQCWLAEDHPYCSRVCCTEALKNALEIKRLVPDARIVILYRDLRSYGFREALYRQARQAGVIFLEYDAENKPQVASAGDDRLRLTVAIQPENEVIELNPDWLVLSAGIEPEPGNSALAQLLKVPVNESGFFLEAHVKLRPVDFAAEGIFLAGLAHSPRSLQETIARDRPSVGRLPCCPNPPPPLHRCQSTHACAACGLCRICPRRPSSNQLWPMLG
jgi:heterodisulfide reductase subunit A-like polyferredoxin